MLTVSQTVKYPFFFDALPYYASETPRKKDSSILFSICPFIFCVSDTSDYLLLNSHWHSQHCLSLACHMRETHSDGTMAPVLFSGTYLS